MDGFSFKYDRSIDGLFRPSYVLVRMRYFLAVKYKQIARRVFFSVRENSTQCLTLVVQWDVKIELKYSQNFRK